MSSITSSDPSASEAAELKVMISCEREDEPENTETGSCTEETPSNKTEENEDEDDLSHLSLIPMLKKIGTEWTSYEWREWKCDIKFIGKQSWNTLLLGLRYQLE